ncbi:MAG: Localization factor PodJL [Alphaproteobacteria bacterium ADurb.Bin438]|nr:MAG: Localization factor PodJL [Alphaproteobacteria bacterium ADurb.Bin438]
MYRYGVLGKKDYDKGNYYFKFLELEPFNDVASTDAEAYFNRGRRLIYKNPDNAIDVLLNAKELGLKEAGDIVNIVILNDNKAYKTSTKGFEVLKNFAESGNVNAMNMLGEIYKDGKIVKKDIEQSKKWLKEATDKGDVIASRNLGLLYLDEGDSITALRWFTNSAEGKDAVSAYYVAQIYGTNEILKDEKQSEEWFLKAAELGNFKAMAVAGAMYVNGTKFVSKDYAKAYAWLYLASNGFVGLEKQKLIEKSLVIKTHLSEQELEKANEYIIKYQK